MAVRNAPRPKTYLIELVHLSGAEANLRLSVLAEQLRG